MTESTNLDTAILEAQGLEDRHVFKCQVKKVNIQVHAPIAESRGEASRYETEVAILVPDKSYSGFSKFMIEHYDEDELPNNEEYLAILPYPVRSFCRLSFDMANEQHDDFHFMVMTEKVDETLRSHMIDKTIEIEILPASYELNRELED